jgi:hypothetical protein
VPLFPELRHHLEAAFRDAPDGALHLVGGRHRSGDVNLRTTLQRAIRLAGLEAWPKLFVNLRSSRETELAERYPLHVVVAWMGNTETVALKHYLRVTDEHFESGAKSGPARGRT